MTFRGPNRVSSPILTTLSNTRAHQVSTGDGYALVDLPAPLGKIALGICMDMNPITSKIITSYEDIPYELADFAIEHDARILLLLANWLDPGKAGDADEWCDSTINYWAQRVWPMFKGDEDESSASNSKSGEDASAATNDTAAKADSPSLDERLVVICNRTGVEKGTFPFPVFSRLLCRFVLSL